MPCEPVLQVCVALPAILLEPINNYTGVPRRSLAKYACKDAVWMISTHQLRNKGQAFSVIGQTDSYAEASDWDCNNNVGTPSMNGMRLRNPPQLGRRCCL